MTIKTTTHKDLTCILSNKNHAYRVKESGQVLTSGTTFISNHFPKFDAPAVAEEIAEKRETTPAALLKEWKEKGEKAAHEGKLVHEYAEFVFSNEDRPPYYVEHDGRVGRLTVQMLLAIERLCARGYEPIEAEKIIFSPTLGVAGQVDLLMWGPFRTLLILDWKTSENMTLDNPFQFGLGPNAIRPILKPEFLNPGEPGYFTPDIDVIVIGFQWNEETRAYPISTMSFVEIANDIIVDMPIAVGY